MLRRIVYHGVQLQQIFEKVPVETVKFTPVWRVQRSSFKTTSPVLELTTNEYEKLSKTALDNLCEYFETILENAENSDISLSDGVLTVKLGGDLGTYVINKQTPNKQLWLSSPISGPKRYDYVNSKWVYKHDNCDMNSLLTEEFRALLKNNQIDFGKLGDT